MPDFPNQTQTNTSMKTTHRILITALLLFAAALNVHAGPISKGGFVIKKPGKYFLIKDIAPPAKGDLSGHHYAITIETSNVELDLAGFTISGAGPLAQSSVAIRILDGVRDVRIRNGRISYCETGIAAGSLSNTRVDNLRICDLQVTGCHFSMRLRGSGIAVERCIVSDVGGQGYGIILDAEDGGGIINECSVFGSPGNGAYGILANKPGLLVRDSMLHNLNTGLHAPDGTKVFSTFTYGCTNAFEGAVLKYGSSN
jgi:Right handed beta helix region